MSNIKNADQMEQFIKEGKEIDPLLLEIMLKIISRNRNSNDENDTDMMNTTKTTTDYPIELSFDSFINKIDEYISSFNIDYLLKKPDFFLEYSDDNIQKFASGANEVLYISKNDNAEILGNNDIMNMSRSTKTDIEPDFAQKKQFYDINTEFICRERIFKDNVNDPKNQELIFKYQYLVNTFFNKVIKEYLIKNKLNENDIMFVYKGGTFMKIIYSKYSTLFKNNSNLIEINKDQFKRSDSDYAIFIDANKFNREEYTKHYYNINILSYNILDKIKLFLENNLNDILPINQLEETDLIELLNKHNSHLHKNRKQADKSLLYFKDVKEFIGISIYNKTYMKENIPTNFDLYKLKTPIDEHGNVIIKKKVIDKDIYIKEHRNIPIERNFFYITLKDGTDSKLYPAISINPTTDEPCSSGIFQYYNESNRFIAQNNPSLINYFLLHRVKLNIILYFKTFNNRFGFFMCPSELIDVPISTFIDYKIKFDFDKYLKSYKNMTLNKNVLFNSYTIYGIINDIYNAFFLESEYPWDDVKYDKKIKRVMFFLILYLNNNYSNIIEIIEKIKLFLIDFNTTDALNIKFKDNNGVELGTIDYLYKNFIENIENIKKRIDSSGILENMEKLKNMINIISAEINSFNSEKVESNYDVSPEEVPYLKKYLKYKNKYLKLKNN